jgi:hypothetical protein
MRKRLAAEAERASLLERSGNNRRSRLRNRQSVDSDKDDIGLHFVEGRDDSVDSKMHSRSAEEVPDTRETSPVGLDIYKYIDSLIIPLES